MTARSPHVGIVLSTAGTTRGQGARRGAPIAVGWIRRWKNLLIKELFILPKDLADRTGAMAKSRSLSWRLGVSTLVIVLPLVLFALLMVGWIAHDEREVERNELIGDAYALADTVGREINAYFLLSAALSHSRPLQHGDLAGFAEQARDTLAEAPGVKLIVSTTDGDPVLSIPSAPPDSPLLHDRAALVRRAIESGSAFLSDVNADPALPEPNASIETPVFLDGKPIYEIAMLLSLDTIPRSDATSELSAKLAVWNRRSQGRFRRADSERSWGSGDAGERGVS